MSFFIFSFFTFILFSFGPYWGKAGNFFIPFPSYFLYRIFPMFRNYARFGVLVMVSLCVLAAFGLRDLIQGITKPKKRAAIFCLVTGLVLFEFLNIPAYRIIDISRPPEVYHWLKEQPGDFAMAEYPLDGDLRQYLFYQRIHQKSLFNGAHTGTPTYDLQKRLLRLSYPNTVQVLRRLGIKYAIVHLDTYHFSDGTEVYGELPDFSQVAGLELVKSFDDVAVYRINEQETQSLKITQKVKIPIKQPEKKVSKKSIKKEDSIDVRKFKFKEGEKLTFNMKYMGIIPVGLMEMTFKGITTYNGHKVYHLIARGKTNKFFSFFFKVNAKFESYMDVKSLCSRCYKELIQIRGQQPQDKSVVYNLEEQVMEYRGHKKEYKKKISTCQRDPFAIIYYIRSQELEVGKGFNFDVNVSKKDSRIEAKVLKKQEVTTARGRVNAWIVKAILKRDDDSDFPVELIFWLADNKDKTPLIMKIKTPGGFISLNFLEKTN